MDDFSEPSKVVTEKDIDPAEIPFGSPASLSHHHTNSSKRLSYGESLSGSSFSGSSSNHSRTGSGSESDSCFSEEEDEVEYEDGAGSRHGAGYPVPYRRYTEGVTLTQRPPCQTRRYGLEWVIQDKRRFKEEVRMQLGAKPTTMYSTTTQCFINSKFRRYRDAVYLIPGAAGATTAPKRFTTTVFVFPKFPRKNVVSNLEYQSAKTVKWYKVAVELEARDFVSVKLVHVS